MLASRAITGMFEVLAITTVRSSSVPPVRGSSSAASSVERVRQLVPALPAPDEDDHIGLAPLDDLLQQHRLAGTEPARHRGACTLGDREQHIDHALAGDQRHRQAEPRRAPAAAYAPATARRPGPPVPPTVAIASSSSTSPASATHSISPPQPDGHQHAMVDPRGRRDGAEDRSGSDGCAGPRGRDEPPPPRGAVLPERAGCQPRRAARSAGAAGRRRPHRAGPGRAAPTAAGRGPPRGPRPAARPCTRRPGR